MRDEDQLKKYTEELRESMIPPSEEEMIRRYKAAERLRERFLSKPIVHQHYIEQDRKYGMAYWLRMQGTSKMNYILQPDGTYK